MQISYSCKILNVKLKKWINTTGTTLDIKRTVSQDFLTLFCQKFHWDREGGGLYTGIIYANLTETLNTVPVPVLTYCYLRVPILRYAKRFYLDITATDIIRTFTKKTFLF